MAREKDERGSASNKSKRDFKSKKSGNIQKEDVEIIKNQLMALGLTLREVPGDGNCLFRALGDQLDGHMANHFRHRHDTTNYMREHRDDFRPFVEDDVPFEKYISTLVQPGTYAGNDAIVAFARNHQVTVVIHQPNAPLWQIKGWEVESVSNNVATKKKNKLHIHRHPQLHIAYHGGDHYDSVRRIGDSNHTPANIWIEVDNNCKEAINEDQGCVFQEICDVGELEETSEIEREAMARSGCSDLLTVRQLLYNNCGNIEAAVEDLIALSNSSLATSASEEKTHSTASSANRKKSSRKSLKVRKQERKRASEERKKFTANVNSPVPDDVLVIHKVQCLNI